VSGFAPRRVLVVSANAPRRRGWLRAVAGVGDAASSCDGRLCPLLGGGTCELLASATTAVYDEATTTSDLFLALVRTVSRPTVIFARDSGARVAHRPRPVRILDQRGAATIYPHLR
jgi:hypothetical protein